MEQVKQLQQGQPGQPGTQPQAPWQRVDIKELFAMIGELNVQLRVSSQLVEELRQKNTALEKALADMKAAGSAKKGGPSA